MEEKNNSLSLRRIYGSNSNRC